MAGEPVLLDTDTLSQLSRGNAAVVSRARAYLVEFGRLTITSITVFERLRGYRLAIRAGKPLQRQMQAFEAFVANCVVLPFDDLAADIAATIWSALSHHQQRHIGDILIAGVAIARQIPLVTRNRRDFEVFSKSSGLDLSLVDWTTSCKRSIR
jgi:predicted nucleic acid-binding protein